jgi:hypothetical protein
VPTVEQNSAMVEPVQEDDALLLEHKECRIKKLRNLREAPFRQDWNNCMLN